MARITDRSDSTGARLLRVRHHTSDANLDSIKAANAINPGRGWGGIVSGSTSRSSLLGPPGLFARGDRVQKQISVFNKTVLTSNLTPRPDWYVCPASVPGTSDLFPLLMINRFPWKEEILCSSR